MRSFDPYRQYPPNACILGTSSNWNELNLENTHNLNRNWQMFYVYSWLVRFWNYLFLYYLIQCNCQWNHTRRTLLQGCIPLLVPSNFYRRLNEYKTVLRYNILLFTNNKSSIFEKVQWYNHIYYCCLYNDPFGRGGKHHIYKFGYGY